MCIRDRCVCVCVCDDSLQHCILLKNKMYSITFVLLTEKLIETNKCSMQRQWQCTTMITDKLMNPTRTKNFFSFHLLTRARTHTRAKINNGSMCVCVCARARALSAGATFNYRILGTKIGSFLNLEPLYRKDNKKKMFITWKTI